MKIDRIFQVHSTVSAYSVFQVAAKDMKQAVTKAENVIKKIDQNAEITEIKALSLKLLDE